MMTGVELPVPKSDGDGRIGSTREHIVSINTRVMVEAARASKDSMLTSGTDFRDQETLGKISRFSACDGSGFVGRC